MEVNSQELEYCKLLVSYQGDFSTIETKRKKVLNDFRKLTVPGYRPGKASDDALRAHYKKEMEEAVKSEMLNHALDDILFETKAKPVGQPQVVEAKLSDFGFSCQMMILKKPDFELKNYKEFELPKPHQEIDEAGMAEKILQELRQRSGEVVPYGENDFVQMGDRITMDLTVSEEGQEPVSEEGALYEVGSNVISGLDDNLQGMAPDEEREFDVDTSEKKFHVKVKVHMGMRIIPADATDEFAERFGYKDMTDMMANLTATASQRLEMDAQGQLQYQVNKRLVAEHQFEVPEWLLKMETQMTAARQGLNFAELEEKVQAGITEEAKEQIRLTFILDSIRDKEPESVCSNEETMNYLVSFLQSRGQDPKEGIKALEESGKLLGLVAQIRNEYTTQWVVDTCKVVE